MREMARIIDTLEQGDAQAAEQLLPLVYDELRGLATRKLAQEKAGQTLQPTALVHEAYLRLVGMSGERGWNGRAHFFAAAAEAMRRILIENARRKGSVKRGGNLRRQELDPSSVQAPEADDELIALDEALTRLSDVEPEVAQLVKLRFFCGLTIKQAAESLRISPRTADAWWAYARAWLIAEMKSSGG